MFVYVLINFDLNYLSWHVRELFSILLFYYMYLLTIYQDHDLLMEFECANIIIKNLKIRVADSTVP